MARIARIVIPNVPHHVTQRGNRKQPTFFCDDDYKMYLNCLKNSCLAFETELWAYCLMDNHVHLILYPRTEEGLRKTVARCHESYTRYINFKMRWRGYLWQGRFNSCPMDDAYLLKAARYIELNPVKAKMVQKAQDYTWSSARAHLGLEQNPFIKEKHFLDEPQNWEDFLSNGIETSELEKIQRHIRTGRPLGNDNFIKHLEQITGRFFFPKKPGPKSNK